MNARAAVLLIALAATRPALAKDVAPVVAVFGIEDARPPKIRLPANELENLTDYLAAKLSAGGKFKLVPNAQLRSALADKKAESYRACYDTSCQVEIGKELAAQKSLSTKIMMIGDQCFTVSTIYDLRESASDRSADHEGACDPKAISEALRKIALELAGEPSSTRSAPAGEPASTKQPAKPGRAYFGSIPDYAARVPGMLIAGVRGDSPADKAGLRQGDVVTRFASRPISNLGDFLAAMNACAPGDVVSLTVLRDNREQTLQATLAAKPE